MIDREFNFNCDICKADIVKGAKFTIESTEWETETEGEGGGIDEEKVCSKCNDKIKSYIGMISARNSC